MRALRRFVPLLPAALLGMMALVALSSGVGSAVAAALGLAALGVVVGVAASWLSLRGPVRAMSRALGQIADGEPGSPVETRRLGELASLGIPLQQVIEAFKSAQEAASIDRLTRVASRPSLLDNLFQEVGRATRHNRPLAIAFVDIDHFKSVNDTHGHAAGDVVLRGVAAVFKEHLRAADFIGRYGGEEFMVILPETTIEEATAVAEKLRLLVLKQRFVVGDGVELGVSVSIGIAGGLGQHLRVEQLVRDADAAMYSAKGLGRNQTYVFAEPDEDSRVPRAPISPEGRARATAVGEAARQAAEATLAAIISPLPHYRGKPSSLIAAIAVRLAHEMDLPEPEVERIRVAALLHDIGKVAVPESILEKPGPLTSTEWQSVVQHPRIGQVIIDQVAAVKDAGAIILHHHEHYAGHGYPYGLRGAEIPLGARIVAIADAYDAMIHDRPYKGAMSHDAAIAELRAHAARQFDPQLVALFCDLYSAEPPTADPSLLIRPPNALSASRPRRDRKQAATG